MKKQTSSRAGKPEWRKTFIEVLGKIPIVAVACDQANVSRQAAYAHRRVNKQFAAKWDEAIQRGVELLEASAWRRASVGITEPILKQDPSGQWITVAERKVFSDGLTMFLLRAHAPKKYRDRHEISGPDDGPIRVDVEKALARAYGEVAAESNGEAPSPA